MKGEEQEQQKKEIDDRVFQAAASSKKSPDAGTADITFVKLEVAAKDDFTQLEKKDGQWRLTGAHNAAADRYTVDAITSQLVTAKFKSKLEEKPTDEELKKYGLLTPKFTVTALTEAAGWLGEAAQARRWDRQPVRWLGLHAPR